MNNRTVELILKARDEATATWNRFATQITKDLGSIQSQFSRLGSLVSGIFSVYVFKNLLNAGVESERQITRLSAALQVAGVYTEPLAKQMEAYADALSLTTNYSHEAILNTMTLLVSFTGLAGDAVQPLTKSVIDFAKMTGLSTDRVAMLVAKTMAGHNAMKRYGVAIDETKTGTERLKDITEGLQKVSGDFAEIQAKSLAGSYDAMVVSLHRLEEAAGTALLKAFAPLMTFLTTVMPAVGKALETLVSLWMAASASIVQAIYEPFAAMELLLNTMGMNVGKRFETYVLIARAAVQKSKAEFDAIWNAAAGSTSGISAVGKKVVDTVERIVQTFKKLGPQGIEFISDDQKKRFEDSEKMAQHIAEWMKQSSATREGLMRENLGALGAKNLEGIKVPEMVDTQELIKFNAFEAKLIELNKLGENVSKSIFTDFDNGIDNMVQGMINGTETMAEAFKKMALAIISDIIAMTAKMLIFRVISGLLSGGASEGVGAVSGATGATGLGAYGGMESVRTNPGGGGSYGGPSTINVTVHAIDAKSFADRMREGDWQRAMINGFKMAGRREVSL